MARFLVAAVLTTLACASLALPHSHSDILKPESQNGAPMLAMIEPEAGSGDLKFFFFPFNFWNGFKPLPWIPLPGLQLPTTAAPAKGEDDKGDDDKDDDEDKNEDKEDGDDKDDEDKDKEAADEEEDAGDEDKEDEDEE